MTDAGVHGLKKGVLFSWLAVPMFPVAVFLGFIGMCAGPESAGGATLLFGIGAFGFGAAAYGAFRIVRGIRFGSRPLQIFSLISLCVAVLAGFIGWELAYAGADAAKYFLHHN